MKAHSAVFTLLVIGMLFLPGCPKEIPQYTSANLNVNAWRTAGDYYAVGAEVDTPSDGETDTERELVEPDVIRREGDRLYVLNQYRGLTIADLTNEVVLSQTPTYGYPRDLYLVGNEAYVLVSYARDVAVEEDLIRVAYGSKLYVFDIADPAVVSVKGVFSFEGDLVDSRMVGDVIYAVTSDYSWYECCEDGTVSTETMTKSYGNTGAVSINITDPENIYMADSVTFSGYGNLIQATNYAIFTVTNDYEGNNSLITYVDITDPSGKITVRGTTAAPGYMEDRFKMDAWNGALRVVTNTWWPDRKTFVTAFDITDPDTFGQIGQTALENASGETLYATRFDGPLAYVVTYFTVDPLFVIDLSDPTAPAVVGELKIPGWSTYIEPRGDRLIALGVDDQEGRRVMVSLFDVSDPAAPERLDYVSFGDGWSWSSAYSDVKALTVLDDMILVPFSGYNQDSGGGYDRLQFISYTRDALAVQGFVDVQGSVVRSLEYADRYYAVTQEELAVIDGADPAGPMVENTLALAENVVDVLPLENGWKVEVIQRYDSGDVLLRAKDYEGGAEAGTLAVSAANVSEAFGWHNAVALVSPVYEYDPKYRAYYRIRLVDFSDVDDPVEIGVWTANIEPWWGGWWQDGGGILYTEDVEVAVDTADAKDMAYYPYYYSSEAAAFLAGDFLVLRGSRSGGIWWWNDDTYRNTLAVIDLADSDVVRYLDLGKQNIQSMAVADNLIYITTFDEVQAVDDRGAYCSYYLQTMNPFNLQLGARINVPGTFMYKAPGTGYLVFEDQQYNENGGASTLLRSATLYDDGATLVDSLDLGEGYWDFTADGADLYFAGMPYSNVYYYGDDVVDSEPGVVTVEPVAEAAKDTEEYYKAGMYSLSGNGMFEEGAVRPVSADWCLLLGAHNQQLYLTVAGSVIARYDFSQSPPVLVELEPTMSYPSKIRFEDAAAYIPLGYSGVAVME